MFVLVRRLSCTSCTLWLFTEGTEVPKISHQENVEAVENVPQARCSVRRCEESEVIDVTKISSQGPSLLRIEEQMIDVTKISDTRDEGWQRAVVQFLDDTRHKPISRISASTRELKRICLCLRGQKKMYSAMFGAGRWSGEA